MGSENQNTGPLDRVTRNSGPGRWTLRFATLALLLAALPGCTVAYYQLNNDRLLSAAENAEKPVCVPRFSLLFDGFDYTNTFGAKDLADNTVQQRRAFYAEATRDVFAEYGCEPRLTAHPADTDLKIQIRRQAYISALPQEWLTGLSFGFIPSWGTRPNQFIYTFNGPAANRSHRYTVDEKSFNHLVLFPFFWITLLGLDESRPYQAALRNYLDHADSGALVVSASP